ncbi:expressed unknown protein [Seminavis robusta]|uniref:Uncharacterized protein n=1 Tax=Seminavis robusta TaxID=568900 RepID=A0A9N8E634_9STRA|nr:expressed unknown protein [Seminavis robusta]|eukprot:Sro692_g188020.1 n/a (373) ;mRNA; f:15841-16959
MTRSSPDVSTTRSLITLTLLFVSNHVAKAEDFGQAFSHTQNGKNNGDETYIIISFSAFLAFCILSVVATIAYFSTLEDRLMKRYLQEGEVIEAVVVSAEFKRFGKAAWGSSDKDAMATEYVLFVEYNKPIAEGSYMTKVRKQIKANEDDVVWRRRGLVPCYSNTCDQCEESIPLDSPLQVQRMLQMLHDDEEAKKNPDGIGKIDMVVLPNFHKSGVSRRQVERANGSRHRLSTAALILSGLGLSAFCIRLAAEAISISHIIDEGTTSTNTVTLYIALAFAGLVLVEIVLVHCCLHKAFVDALEEEYLKSGDLIPIDEDDSSLSTGSDFFLGKAIQAHAARNLAINGSGGFSPVIHPPNQVFPTSRVPSTVNI